MNHELIPDDLYPATQDDSAPFGWTTETFFYRPDWGDRLVHRNGKTFVQTTQSDEKTLTQLTLQDLQQYWGDISEIDRLFASPSNPEVAAVSQELDRLVELHNQHS